MKLRQKIEYYESCLPPRCCKLCYRKCEEVVELNLAETTLGAMALAFYVDYHEEERIYHFRGKLW